LIHLFRIISIGRSSLIRTRRPDFPSVFPRAQCRAVELRVTWAWTRNHQRDHWSSRRGYFSYQRREEKGFHFHTEHAHHVTNSLETGFDEYISKPPSPKDLGLALGRAAVGWRSGNEDIQCAEGFLRGVFVVDQGVDIEVPLKLAKDFDSFLHA